MPQIDDLTSIIDMDNKTKKLCCMPVWHNIVVITLWMWGYSGGSPTAIQA